MVGLTLTGGNKDYFKELRLKRQQRAQTAETGAGSFTSATEAAVPIIVVSGPDATRPPVNPKKRTKDDHGKDQGRYSRRHGELSSGKSPKRGRGVGGSSSGGLDFFSHDLRVADGVTLNPYEQDYFLSARPSQVHDAFMELCSRTLVLGKRMASDLLKRDKSAAKVESLRSQLEDSTAKLQLVLEGNNSLLGKNKDLEAEVNHWKGLCAKAERNGREVADKADEEIRGLKESLSDMALTNYRSE